MIVLAPAGLQGLPKKLNTPAGSDVIPKNCISFKLPLTLDDPALGHYLESVQFAAPGDLHRDFFSQEISPALGE